jgi:hypothetical protein
MILELDLDLMKAYKLSLEEYALLLLLNQNQFERIREYFDKDEALYKLLDSIVKRKYIMLREYGFRECLSDYKVLFVPHYLATDFDKWFNELTSVYPKTVKRPGGDDDMLVVNLPKCKALYKKATKGNKHTHEHIMACLRYQLNYLKKKTTGLMYLKRLYKWLEEEGWKDFEEIMLREAKYMKEHPQQGIEKDEGDLGYGQRII